MKSIVATDKTAAHNGVNRTNRPTIHLYVGELDFPATKDGGCCSVGAELLGSRKECVNASKVL
jgi:hypothetical protein